MRKLLTILTLFLVMPIAPGFAADPALGPCAAPVAITFPATFEWIRSRNIEFTPVGGQVFVSNAPESIWDDGATRADGSVITGQVNATLYRDRVTGSFRLWASHHNRTSGPIVFWVYVKNDNDYRIRLYRHLEGYGVGSVTGAAGDATVAFMNAKPDPTLLATVEPGAAHFYRYSPQVMPDQASVYITELRAEGMDGSDATVEVSHVVTRAEVADPTPYATTDTIARTNATRDRSDDYRGLLKHWGRVGRITFRLDDVSRVRAFKLADLGYEGEQEPLMSRWNTMGEPVESHVVRFVSPTVDRIRLAYWYTDYELHVELQNDSPYPLVHTLYGSNGSNPGFVSYQLNGGNVTHCHFSANHAVPVTTLDTYRLRTMVMPSATLPFAMYFVVGDEEGMYQGAR